MYHRPKPFPHEAISRRPEQTPRVSPDLVEYLRKHYPPRCIKAGESEIAAHRYAAQAELAEKLIRFASKGEDRPDYSIQED